MPSLPMTTSKGTGTIKELLSDREARKYEDVVKNEVQRAIAADEEALTRLCGNYIDNVKAYTQREKVRNKLHRQPTKNPMNA